MRKFFTLLFLASFAFAQAQYYIPNSDFESWKGSAGSTYQSSDGSSKGGSSALGMRQRPGDEPSDWEGSSINQQVIMEKKETLIEKSTSYNGSTAVKMTNKDVKVLGIGSTAPGFISFATPWVYAISTVSACDGGVYGGIQLKGRPDAIKGRFNRSGGTGETAHIIAYLWNGTYKSNIKSSVSNDTKEDCDKVIMGKETGAMQEGKRIASCDYSFVATNGWEEITVSLNYNYDEVPEKMNVILSSGDYWTRGNIKNGSVLEADDVQFVYYSELASLKFEGKNYFSNGKTSYTIPAAYDEGKLEITSNGKYAKIEKSYNATSKTLTVTIKGDDYAANNNSKHVYTILFDENASVVAPDGPKPLGSRLYSLADADEDKTYVLYNEHFTTYAIYEQGHGDRVWVAGMIGDSSHPLNNSAYGNAVDITSENACWQVIKDGDKYQLFNVGAQMYLTTPQYEYTETPKYCSFSSTPVSLKIESLGNGAFAFNANPGHTNANLGYMCAAPNQVNPISVWSSGDSGSAWVLIENPNVTFTEVVDPEQPELPEYGEVNYTPTFTGVKTSQYSNRWIYSVTLNSTEYSDEAENVLNVDNDDKLCFNDYTESVTMKAAPGEKVTLVLNIGDATWINAFAYIDVDADGFTAGIADGSNWQPAGDLVSYSFYNNNDAYDNNGWNSAGDVVRGGGTPDERSSVNLPSFVVPEEPGVYRMRVKLDWCNIDPMGDSDGKFGDFMDNGGQIVDFMLEVVDTDAPEADIEDVEEEVSPVFEGIYDLQGRKLDEITKTGIYIINGKKVFVKK